MNCNGNKRIVALFSIGVAALLLSFFSILFVGSVSLSFTEVFNILFGGKPSSTYASTILIETRLPIAVAALCCGSILSVAGLMMQTLFQNPLAGPSVLGVSSGASFGVAVIMLGAGELISFSATWFQPIATTLSALLGGMFTVILLYLFSTAVKSSVALLIVGLMLSYLFSSAISLLNYFSPPEEIRSYLVWGLGSLSGLRFDSSLWLLFFSGLILIPSILYIKPLNALLLGERYLESVGYQIKKTRGGILILTGMMVAIPTAFCGPIGFIGLIVPHLCRLLYKTSNHLLLLPACALWGAVVTLLCALICQCMASSHGVLPINILTPFIGVPVILYLLLNRSKLPYLS